MIASVDHALEQLYPTRTWGEPDEPGEPALEPDELAAIAEELATELRAATFVRHGGDDEPCDFIYVLCVGRTPCAVQARDFGVALDSEATEPIRELYLRVVISQRARVAAVQQVAIDIEPTPGGLIFRESPRAGVYDAPLLRSDEHTSELQSPA